MDQKCLFNIAHKCGMVDLHSGEGTASYERNHIADLNPVAAVEWSNRCALVLETQGHEGSWGGE